MARPIGAEALVALLEGGLDRVVLIDSRSFVDFNSSHILDAININGSKLMKRRLQQDKVQIGELLQLSARSKLELQEALEVVVYDQTTSDPTVLGCDCFLSVLLAKLQRSFSSVHLLSGGFAEFSRLYPGLCEGKSAPVPFGMSQPSLPPPPVSGPTCILPHLYLGCQRDVLNQDVMQQNAIMFVLNASHTCPKPDFIPESNFLRVPVNDSFCEKILPWLDRSLEFIEKAKTSNGRVLVHCLAGISRSATIAIAYIMKRMDLSLDEAYRFVKEKRPTISPNFNFLGQLLDFEKKIKTPHATQTKLKSLLLPEAPPLSQAMEVRVELQDATELQLVQTLRSLQLADVLEDSARLKRSFSLDIKSYGEPVGSAPHRPPAPHAGSTETSDFFKEPTSKPSQFFSVAEVSERSTPERSPDTEETMAREYGGGWLPAAAGPRLGMEENTTGFLLGLSRSQQPLSTVGGGLKGWSSDLLLGSVTSSLAGGWYLSPDSSCFFSTSTVLGGGGGGGGGFGAYSCSHGLKVVRRRGRQRAGDQGDSRRSWHEESSFEKQLKQRSCQMELGEGRTDRRSRDELRTLSAQDAFSGSMEVIQVS